MTHLPFVVASYGIFAAMAVVLATTAQFRLASATRKLRVVDPRAQDARP